VRKALANLPWVEHDSVQTDVYAREVRFNVEDRSAFNEDAVKEALRAQGFKEVTVKSAPQ